MDFRASHRFARISPRKARLVMDLIRGKPINRALEILKFNRKRGAYMIDKVVRSALANAENRITEQRLPIDVDSLYVADARVDRGPKYRRWRPRSRGLVHPYYKFTSHLSVILREVVEPEDEEGKKSKKKKRKRK